MRNNLSRITIEQRQGLDRVLDQAGLTRKDVERILERPELAKKMVDTLRGELSRGAPSIDWTPVSRYAHKVRDWNRRFDLGFTEDQIDGLEANLPDHGGSYQPTSITLTFGEYPWHNHRVTQKILSFEHERAGVPLVDLLEGKSMWYLEGSESKEGVQLAPAALDIEAYWEPLDGISHREIYRQCARWPTHEVAVLLALNPHVYQRMNQKTIPFLVAAGLLVGSDEVLLFSRENDKACVRGGWSGNLRRSIVAFREG